MIRVLSVSVYKVGEDKRIFYESFRDKQFETNEDIRDWTHGLEKQWGEWKGYPCKAYPTRRTKPKEGIDMMAVLIHTAHIMEQPIELVLNGKRKRELVDVRKMACMILMEGYDFQPMQLEDKLPFKNRVIYNYREKMEDRIATERGFEDQYKKIKKKVMDLMIEN